MKHINIAIENMNNSTTIKDEENLSIIERIVQKTGNPKIAAILALDLFLVGVDTVNAWLYLNIQKYELCVCVLKSGNRNRIDWNANYTQPFSISVVRV